MNTEFTNRDIAEFKRTAHNVYPSYAKKEKLAAKIAELQAQVAVYEQEIALKEAYVMAKTGHHVMDIVDRVVTTTPVLNEDGSIKFNEKGVAVSNTTTEYVLKYPETIVPVVEETALEDTFNPSSDPIESIAED